MLELLDGDTAYGYGALEGIGFVIQHLQKHACRRKVAAIGQSGDYVVIEKVIVIVVVVAYVEKAVALEAHRLMDLEIQRNCFHNMYGVTLWSVLLYL